MLPQVHVLQQRLFVWDDAVNVKQLAGSLGSHLRNLMNDHHWFQDRLSAFICLHIILFRRSRCHQDLQHNLEFVANSACCHFDHQWAMQQVSFTGDCHQWVQLDNVIAHNQFGYSWMVPPRTISAAPIKSLHNATSRCCATDNVDFNNTSRLTCPTHWMVSNPVGLWLSQPIKNTTIVRFSTKKQRKLARIPVFATFLRLNAKTRKNRFLDRSPARIDFLLWKRRFGTNFGLFGVGGFLQPFLRVSWHHGWVKGWFKNFCDPIW